MPDADAGKPSFEQLRKEFDAMMEAYGRASIESSAIADRVVAMVQAAVTAADNLELGIAEAAMDEVWELIREECALFYKYGEPFKLKRPPNPENN